MPEALYTVVKRRAWDDAVRLCRNWENRFVWAMIAGLSLAARELDTAEVALAAIDDVWWDV